LFHKQLKFKLLSAFLKGTSESDTDQLDGRQNSNEYDPLSDNEDDDEKRDIELVTIKVTDEDGKTKNHPLL
jgi:hypothetical protein